MIEYTRFEANYHLFVTIMTSICIAINVAVFLLVIRKLKKAHVKAYKKLSKLIRICYLISMIIFVARLIYHICVILFVEPHMDMFRGNGHYGYVILVTGFVLTFEAIPAIVINEYAMRYCKTHEAAENTLI